MSLLYYLRTLVNRRWTVGFVQGGMDSIFADKPLQVNWVKLPKDRWFADPFVLDVTDNEILLLVEDLAYKTNKGVISLLHINRKSNKITSRKVLLELPTHLSFPIILRQNGHVYIYPESRFGGKLDLYEYHPETESLTFAATLCDESMWDSVIIDFFGERYIFASTTEDYRYLTIYKWNADTKRFFQVKTISSNIRDMRMGGAAFSYKGAYYIPAQDCSIDYGCALYIKQVEFHNGDFSFKTIKHITSPSSKYPLGFHTLNEYKGVVVVDANGWRYGKLGAVLHATIERIRKFKHK